MMTISVDLDNTIFDLAHLYKAICNRHKVQYVAPISWDVYESYPKCVADDLMVAFESDIMYKNPILDKRIPATLNAIYKNPHIKLYYITERPIGNDRWQLNNAGILCDHNQIINCTPKIHALKKYGVTLCFDDSPQIILDCIENNIDVVMISNEDTAYNHHLRGRVEHYPNLVTALTRRGMIR